MMLFSDEGVQADRIIPSCSCKGTDFSLIYINKNKVFLFFSRYVEKLTYLCKKYSFFGMSSP